MRKNYCVPELTTVSLRAESGFASSVGVKVEEPTVNDSLFKDVWGTSYEEE